MKLDEKFYKNYILKTNIHFLTADEAGNKVIPNTLSVNSTFINYLIELGAMPKSVEVGKTKNHELFWQNAVDGEGQQHASIVSEEMYHYIDMLETKLLQFGFDVKSLIQPPPHDKEKAKKIKDYYDKMEKVWKWKEEQEKLKDKNVTNITK